MKKTRTALLVFLSLTVATASAMAQISKEAAYDIVIQQGLNGSVEGKRVYVMSDPVAANTVVETWKGAINLPAAEGWLFFIDDHPFANWEHPCRYVVVDGATGEYTEIAARVPPDNIGDMEELAGVDVPEAVPMNKLTFPTNGHWYAVNKKAYAALSDDLKAKLELAIYKTRFQEFLWTEYRNLEAVDFFNKKGIETVVMDPETVRTMTKWASDYMDELATKDEFFARVWGSQKEFGKRWYPYVTTHNLPH